MSFFLTRFFKCIDFVCSLAICGEHSFSLLPVEKLKLTLPELHYNNFNDKEFTEILYEKWVNEYLMNKISKYVGSSITQRVGIDYNNLKKNKIKFYRMIGKFNFFK